jgi:hypothetical protein
MQDVDSIPTISLLSVASGVRNVAVDIGLSRTKSRLKGDCR